MVGVAPTLFGNDTRPCDCCYDPSPLGVSLGVRLHKEDPARVRCVYAHVRGSIDGDVDRITPDDALVRS